MRSLALADVTETDLRAMLAENETLFVEHKTGLGGKGFQIAKAMSFANTLGGWVLIGVTNGEPNAGDDSGWEPVPSHELTDRVREALAANGVDPIPAFSATVLPYGDPAKEVGVVRVYESADTPHVMGKGQVFVRSVAQDRHADRVYRAQGVETHAGLVALTDRGRAGLQRAREKLNPDRAPLAAQHVGLSPGSAATESRGVVGIRAVPLTGDRLAEWGVSRRCAEVLEASARKLARREDEAPLDPPAPYASGLAVSARSDDLLELPPVARDGLAVVTTDTAGLVAAAMRFGIWDPPRPQTSLTLNGVRDHLLRPLVAAATDVLTAAELFGRTLLELRIGPLGEVIEVDDEGGKKAIPAALPVGGELSLPLDADDAQLNALLEQWRSVVGRAAGYLTLRP